MTYEELQEKYKPELAERQKTIAEAKRKVDVQTALLNHYKAERETLRPTAGVMDYDTRQQFNYLTFKITEAQNKLDKLKDEHAKAATQFDIEKIANEL